MLWANASDRAAGASLPDRQQFQSVRDFGPSWGLLIRRGIKTLPRRSQRRWCGLPPQRTRSTCNCWVGPLLAGPFRFLFPSSFQNL